MEVGGRGKVVSTSTESVPSAAVDAVVPYSNRIS